MSERPGLFLAVCILATTLTTFAAAWAIWGWPTAAWTLAAGPILGLAAAVIAAMQEGT